MEKTKVELLLGRNNQELLAKLSYLQPYILNLFFKPSLPCKRKKKLKMSKEILKLPSLAAGL